MSFDRVFRLNGLARQTRALPYDQRSFHLFENRDEVHGLGVDPGVLQDFDPTTGSASSNFAACSGVRVARTEVRRVALISCILAMSG